LYLSLIKGNIFFLLILFFELFLDKFDDFLLLSLLFLLLFGFEPKYINII